MGDMKKNKGLSGLSSLVTDVQTIEKHAREQSVDSLESCRNENISPNQNPKPSLQENYEGKEVYQTPDSNNSEASMPSVPIIKRFGWFGIIAIVAVMFFIFSSKAPSGTSSKPQQGNNSVTNKPQITYTAPKPTPAPAPAKPAPVPVPQTISPPISNSASTIAPKPSITYKNPIQVLQAFHQNITNKQYRKAYNYLSEDFQNSVSYEGWAPGFRTTISSTVSNVKNVSQTDNQAVLIYILKAVDYPGGTRYFQGTATFIKTSDGWKIDEITNKAL